MELFFNLIQFLATVVLSIGFLCLSIYHGAVVYFIFSVVFGMLAGVIYNENINGWSVKDYLRKACGRGRK